MENNDFDEDDPDTIILIRLLASHIEFEKHKALKKIISEELMPIAQHSKKWWKFYIQEYKEKEIEPIFTEGYGNFLGQKLLVIFWVKMFQNILYKKLQIKT